MTDMADILSSKILKCLSSFHLNYSVKLENDLNLTTDLHIVFTLHLFSIAVKVSFEKNYTA